MPHINIKYFATSISNKQKSELVFAVTGVIANVFKCHEDVISIALEPIEKNDWNQQVYIPEIKEKSRLLCKVPNY